MIQIVFVFHHRLYTNFQLIIECWYHTQFKIPANMKNSQSDKCITWNCHNANFCRHRWHRRLSYRQPPVPPVATKVGIMTALARLSVTYIEVAPKTDGKRHSDQINAVSHLWPVRFTGILRADSRYQPVISRAPNPCRAAAAKIARVMQGGAQRPRYSNKSLK